MNGTQLAEGRVEEEATVEELGEEKEGTEEGGGGGLSEEIPLSPRSRNTWITRPQDQGWHQGPPVDHPGLKSKALI